MKRYLISTFFILAFCALIFAFDNVKTAEAVQGDYNFTLGQFKGFYPGGDWQSSPAGTAYDWSIEEPSRNFVIPDMPSVVSEFGSFLLQNPATDASPMWKYQSGNGGNYLNTVTIDTIVCWNESPCRVYDGTYFLEIYTSTNSYNEMVHAGYLLIDVIGGIPYKHSGAIVDSIDFTGPFGYQGAPPQSPLFTGTYSTQNSYWNVISIEVSKHTLTATTSSTFVAQNCINWIIATTTSSGTFTKDCYSFNAGTYSYRAKFLNVSTSTYGIASSSSWFYNDGAYWIFNIGGTNPYSYPLAAPEASTTPMELCEGIAPASMFDVAGGVQWALCNISQWLFVASNVSVQNFQSLGNTFQQKAPFAYFYSVIGAFNNFSASTTPAFTLSSSTGAFNTSIFQPIKTGLTWILWLMFGVWCVKRIAKFDF